jgi:hypothetical protein
MFNFTLTVKGKWEPHNPTMNYFSGLLTKAGMPAQLHLYYGSEPQSRRHKVPGLRGQPVLQLAIIQFSSRA